MPRSKVRKKKSTKKSGARRSRKKASARKTRAARKKSPRRAKAVRGACPLTGLAMGDTARASWEAVYKASNAAGRPSCFALLDLDGFSRHNEQLGSTRADELLVQVVERLQDALEQEDRLARLGGDQWGLMLADTELEEAVTRLELLRQRIVGKVFRLGRGVRGRRVEATVSVGVAGAAKETKGFSGLLSRAQGALWRAKSLGGNRVGLASKERMSLKTSYYPQSQLDQLKRLAKKGQVKEAVLLREALEDLFLKHKQRQPVD